LVINNKYQKPFFRIAFLFSIDSSRDVSFLFYVSNINSLNSIKSSRLSSKTLA